MIELNEGKITLRPFQLEDAVAHLAGDDEEQIKWLSESKSTLKNVEDWILNNQTNWHNGGPVFNFAIIADGKLSGMIEANVDYARLEGLIKGDANISYSLYPNARGKGYVTKAIEILLPFLKEKGIKRAIIRVQAENEKSVAVAQRSGFKKTGAAKDKKGKTLQVFAKDL